MLQSIVEQLSFYNLEAGTPVLLKQLHSPPHGSMIPPPLLPTGEIPSHNLRSYPPRSWTSVLLSRHQCCQYLTREILAHLINQTKGYLYIRALKISLLRWLSRLLQWSCKLKFVDRGHSRKDTARRTFWFESHLQLVSSNITILQLCSLLHKLGFIRHLPQLPEVGTT